MLPQLAQGPANKIFIIPSEFNQALGNLTNAIGSRFGPDDGGGNGPAPPRKTTAEVEKASADAAADAAEAAAAAKAAEEAARSAANPALGLTDPTAPGEPPPPPPAPPA
jgi:hypothetical protein